MAKKSKTYEVTSVYDIYYDVDKPISASMLGKIRKNTDNLEILTDRHIRITRIGKLTAAGEPIDEAKNYSNLDEEMVSNFLRSCSKALRIHKIQIFVL